jgi:hypothetical protein
MVLSQPENGTGSRGNVMQLATGLPYLLSFPPQQLRLEARPAAGTHFDAGKDNDEIAVGVGEKSVLTKSPSEGGLHWDERKGGISCRRRWGACKAVQLCLLGAITYQPSGCVVPPPAKAAAPSVASNLSHMSAVALVLYVTAVGFLCARSVSCSGSVH